MAASASPLSKSQVDGLKRVLLARSPSSTFAAAYGDLPRAADALGIPHARAHAWYASVMGGTSGVKQAARADAYLRSAALEPPVLQERRYYFAFDGGASPMDTLERLGLCATFLHGSADYSGRAHGYLELNLATPQPTVVGWIEALGAACTALVAIDDSPEDRRFAAEALARALAQPSDSAFCTRGRLSEGVACIFRDDMAPELLDRAQEETTQRMRVRTTVRAVLREAFEPPTYPLHVMDALAREVEALHAENLALRQGTGGRGGCRS